MNFIFAFLSLGSFLENLQNKNCPTCSSPQPIEQEHENLKIFMSTSVPMESWKDLSSQLEKTGGVFVLKGLPQDSIELFAKFILDLSSHGINAPIDIDPEGFEKYHIDEVPTIVLEEGHQFDRWVGNLRLDIALKEMSESGDTRTKATELLHKLHD